MLLLEFHGIADLLSRWIGGPLLTFCFSSVRGPDGPDVVRSCRTSHTRASLEQSFDMSEPSSTSGEPVGKHVCVCVCHVAVHLKACTEF